MQYQSLNLLLTHSELFLLDKCLGKSKNIDSCLYLNVYIKSIPNCN